MVPDAPSAVIVAAISNSNAPFVTDAVGVNAPVEHFSADSVPAVESNPTLIVCVIAVLDVVNQPPPLISSDLLTPPVFGNIPFGPAGSEYAGNVVVFGYDITVFDAAVTAAADVGIA